MDTTSTAVSRAIFAKSPSLRSRLKEALTVRPGLVRQLDVTSDACLRCKYLYFVLQDPGRSPAQQPLGLVIRACLELCDQASLSSIAFPAFGDPKEAAARALVGEIQSFKERGQPGWIKSVRIAVPPSDRSGAECLRKAQQEIQTSSTGGRSQADGIGGFCHSLSISEDVARMNVGNIKLQISKGDITKEATDVIVNSTSNTPPRNGVSHAIATASKLHFEHKLQSADLKFGKILLTGPGKLKCKKIMHVCGHDDLNGIQMATESVLRECIKMSFESVAFPAIGTGSGKLHPSLVARMMTDVIASIAQDFPSGPLQLVCIVVSDRFIFNSFTDALAKRLQEASAASTLNAARSNPREAAEKPWSFAEDLPALIHVYGREPADVQEALSLLQGIRRAHFMEASVTHQRLSRLSSGERDALLRLAAQHRVRLTLEGGNLSARGQTWRVEAVLHSALHLLEEADQREFQALLSAVRWSYLTPAGQVPFDPRANSQLEACFREQSRETVVQTGGLTFFVNLHSWEATVSESQEQFQIRRVPANSTQ
ncbi:protein mono-ADP-ribosyltransferase PARP14-like isoform X1 [Cetorhinus maximus]